MVDSLRSAGSIYLGAGVRPPSAQEVPMGSDKSATTGVTNGDLLAREPIRHAAVDKRILSDPIGPGTYTPEQWDRARRALRILTSPAYAERPRLAKRLAVRILRNYR